MARMGDGSAFHLAAHASELLGQALLCLRGGDELVARDDAAREHAHVGCGERGGMFDGDAQGGVGRERQAVHAGELAGLVAPGRDVHVIVESVGAHHEVGDVDLRVERACHARVHDVRYAVQVAHGLHTHTGRHLADAALGNDDRHAGERALAEAHTRTLAEYGVLRVVHEGGDLHVHGADDTELDLLVLHFASFRECAFDFVTNLKTEYCAWLGWSGLTGPAALFGSPGLPVPP